MGNFIQVSGVSTDPAKLKAVREWPVPKNLKTLRGFLGLAGYYRRFVQHFGTTARPFTVLTKKDAFTWNEEAHEAFIKLKATCNAPCCLCLALTSSSLSKLMPLELVLEQCSCRKVILLLI